MTILLIGLSHKTAPLGLRERLTFSPGQLRSALTHFDSHHSQGRVPEVFEGVIISTCNRLEIYAYVHNAKLAKDALIEFLGRACNMAPAEFKPSLYIYHDDDAVMHLFRVASGVDSMVLGESQILGQITQAYEAALSQGAAGTILSALFRAAIHTGKRARTETAIGVNPASVSSVAAGLAEDLLGNLAHQQVMLIGAGEMSEVVIRSLMRRGVSNITVVNRTYESAVELAAQWNGQAFGFQQLGEVLVSADIVITATGAPHTILSSGEIKPVMQIRPARPLFIIDIAVPRDVDPDVTNIAQVHLHDIDSLQDQAEDSTRERQAEIPQVEEIILAEKHKFSEWLSSLEVVSTITDLRQQLEALRQRELDWLFRRLDLDEKQQGLVTQMSHRLLNKILHEPTMRLKQKAINGQGPTYISTTRDLFALDHNDLNQ